MPNKQSQCNYAVENLQTLNIEAELLFACSALSSKGDALESRKLNRGPLPEIQLLALFPEDSAEGRSPYTTIAEVMVFLQLRNSCHAS